MSTNTSTELTGRDRAILRAVAQGRAELVRGTQPELLVDGRRCCDQLAAARLADAGLITGTGPTGQRTQALLTTAGRDQLLAA